MDVEGVVVRRERQERQEPNEELPHVHIFRRREAPGGHYTEDEVALAPEEA